MATDENVMELPYDKVWASGMGFSMDFGASVMKVVYRSKQDQQFHQQQNKVGRLRIMSFSGDEFHAAVKFIEDNCDFGNNTKSTNLQLTGIGCSARKKQLADTFKTSVSVKPETDCIVDGLYLMYTTAKKISDIFYPVPEEGLKLARERIQTQVDFADGLKALTEGKEHKMTDQQQSSAEQDVPEDKYVGTLGVNTGFPCLLVMCGSAFIFLKVEADGSSSFVDQTFKGGKCLHGMATLMTGIQDFRDILQLASEGKSVGVDQTSTELKAGPRDDWYQILPEGVHVFPFGKPVSSKGEKYENKDVLRSLFEVWCMELAQLTKYISVENKLNNVYFCGGFPHSYLVRMLLTKDLAFRNSMLEKENTMQFQFVKNSSHLAALGAYLV